MIGDGVYCRTMTCKDKPCYPSVDCTDMSFSTDGFSCGECPIDMVGDGINCEPLTCDDLDCFGGCKNAVCDPCPEGYEGDGATCIQMVKQSF